MARVRAREGAGRCLLAVPWPEELSFAPEFGSFRSWWVVPTAFILQREGGRFKTCHRAWVSLNQRKSLVWTKHRGAVRRRAAVLFHSCCSCFSPESLPPGPRQPLRAAANTQLPLTHVLSALKQESAKRVGRQTVLRENSEEPRRKIQEPPLKIEPLRKTRGKAHRTRLGLRRKWDLSRSYLPPLSPRPGPSPTHLTTSLRALSIAWRLSEPDLNRV